MIDASAYPWNVQLHLQGVVLTGPGMETRAEAEAIKELLAGEENVTNVVVIEQ